MIINDYALMELNQQRRAQVADSVAALRAATSDHGRRWTSVFRRRTRTATSSHPVPTTIAFGTGPTAH